MFLNILLSLFVAGLLLPQPFTKTLGDRTPETKNVTISQTSKMDISIRVEPDASSGLKSNHKIGFLDLPGGTFIIVNLYAVSQLSNTDP